MARPGRVALLIATFIACASGWQSPAEAEFQRALQLVAAGRFAEAEAPLRALEASHPKLFEVRYRLALVLLRQDKAKEAVSRFQSAVELEPRSAIAWAGMAQARWKLGLKPQALESAGQAKKFAVEQPAAWRALAIFYADANEFANAAECELQWARASPQSAPESMLRAAGYYRIAKQPAKAVDTYQEAIRLAPDREQAYLELAALLLDHRTPQPAVALLGTAVSRFPKNVEFRRLLGLAHYQLGATSDAIEAFLAICDLDPDSELGYASLETLLNDAGTRLPEITARFERFRKLRPSSPVGHYLLAIAGIAQQTPSQETIALLRESIHADKAFWPAHYELGQQLATQGLTAEALVELNEAVRLNPQYAPAHFALARAYTAQGDKDLAIKHRKIHSELLAHERDQAARARSESPALRYRLEPNGR